MVPRVEAQRRIRAVLAMARSLVRRTAQGAQSVEDFEQHLDGRLLALARSQAHVLEGCGSQIDLELLVRDEVRAVLEKEGDRISINGESVRLPLRLAETFTLAVHELLINAVKYGALNQNGGTIAISWHCERLEDATWLIFRWIERCAGLISLSPDRRGFGCDLLEEVMRYEHDADPNLMVGPHGVSYSVRVPLSLRRQGTEGGAPPR